MRFNATIVALLFAFCQVLTAHAEEYIDGKLIKTGFWKGYEIEYVDGEINVLLEKGYSENDLNNSATRFDASIIRSSDRFGFVQLTSSNKGSFLETVAAIDKLESVRWAEPNMVMRVNATPSDPLFPTQWHYNNTGQSPPGGTPDADIDCPEAWGFTTGSQQIMVGVLDTGIPMVDGQLSHPDLDDPNRFILGLNVFTGDLDPVDGYGHGTHVIGTIGAESDNGIGVSGIDWNCRIMALKVFNDNGYGTSSGFRDAVIYAVDNGCQVLNFSGGGSSPSSSSEHGIAYADSHNVILCIAAGNNYGGNVSWPGAYSVDYDNVITVSATDQNDVIASYSSTGPEVVISAPGGYGRPFDEDDVQSTFPNYECQLSVQENLPLNYAPLAGTSMATPHAAGVVSLLLSVDPTMTPLQVRNILTATSVDLGTPGFDNEYGWGRISAYDALLQMGEINIGHQPLDDTKNSVDDYYIYCEIFSIVDLVPDSLLLYYNVGGGWQVEPLSPGTMRGTSGYSAYIPAQQPGTFVDYYMFAKNVDGKYDSTSIFTFKVIDYQLILEPVSQDTTGAGLDTVWYQVTITNDGVYNDTYTLTVSGNTWPVSVWDESGLIPLDETPSMYPDQSMNLSVRVEVPETFNGESDHAILTATSIGDPSQTRSVEFTTVSLGVPLELPFSETFDSTNIDSVKWVLLSGVEVNSDGIGAPSSPYSLNLDGTPNDADTIMSQAIKIAGQSQLSLKYSFQQTGNGESPDEGDDLFVECLNAQGDWILLNTHEGSDPDMTSFEVANVSIPAEAYHNGFRIRFRNTASGVDRDDWFIDDVSLEWAPQISVTVSDSLDITLDSNQTYDVSFTIENTGLSILFYEFEIEPDYTLLSGFGELLQQGMIEPATREYPSDYLQFEPGKGSSDLRKGYDVVFDAGGPDNYGYIWIDSDDDGGPVFNWRDISATGTAITGLTDDSYAGPFPIGFNFPFYDSIYTEFYVSSNGLIGFGPPDNYSALVNDPIPTYDIPGNFIALLWDDLNILDPNNPGGEIKYETIGSKLIVQYINIPEYGAGVGDVFNGEIIIDSDGEIRLQYDNFGSGFDINNCTVGIEDPDGFSGLEVVFNASYLHDDLCVLINVPSVIWLSVSPATGSVEPSSSEDVTLAFSSSGIDAGTYAADVFIYNNDPDSTDNPWHGNATMTVQVAYTAGDANGDTGLDVDDVVFILSYIFSGGNPPDPLDSADADCNGYVDIDDAVFLINYIFSGGPAPCTVQ